MIAGSMEEALTLWRKSDAADPVLSIIALPDSPTVPDERAEAQRAGLWKCRTCGVISNPSIPPSGNWGWGGNGGMQWKHRHEGGVWHEADPIDGVPVIRREAIVTPEARIDALEAELRQRTEERDQAGAHRAQLIAAIHEPPAVLPVGEMVDAAARIARETREERNEFSAKVGSLHGALSRLAQAVSGQSDVEFWGKHLDDPAIVEQAKTTREERDHLAGRLATCQTAGDAAREERDRLRVDLAEANAHRCSPLCEQMAETRKAAGQRDALQKRLNAAKAWILADRRVGLAVAGPIIIGILEGRTP